MTRCRACKTLRTRGDLCPNADCPKNTTTTVCIKGRNGPISATTKHGYHAPMTTTSRLVADYDAPIRAKTWRTVA